MTVRTRGIILSAVVGIATLGFATLSLAADAPAGRGAAGATGASAPATGAKDSAGADAAVAKLVADANELFADKSLKNVTVTRPYPSVKPLDPAAAPQVIRAMLGKLTGDPIKDTWIRYHLMYVVNQAAGNTPEKLSAQLNDLARTVPNEDLEFEAKPYSTLDNPEIASRYWKLMQEASEVVGYPPFQKTISPPESFEHMEGARKAAAEAAFAEATKLKAQFKQVPIPENGPWNNRMNAVRFATRQYRGDVLYAGIAEGNQKSLTQIVDAIVKSAATDPMRATDMASFLNAAYFNGHLAQFKKEELQSIVTKLKRFTNSGGAAPAPAPGTRPPRPAPKPKEPPGAKPGTPPAPGAPNPAFTWVPVSGRQRMLSDALFTVVTGIEVDRIPPVIPADEKTRPEKEVAVPTDPATPENLSLERIDSAITRGLIGLDHLQPPDVDFGAYSYEAVGMGSQFYSGEFTRPGHTALAAWGMFASGEPSHAAWMQRRLNWVLCYDSPSTYDRAMRLRAIATQRNKKLEPWLKRDTAWLIETMTDQGNWLAANTGKKSAEYGDNANGQYAMLGLWAAEEAGLPIPPNVWQKVDSYWRTAQFPSGSPGAGSWAVLSNAANKAGATGFNVKPSLPMTAAGCLSLYLTEMYLYGPKRVDVNQSLSPELLTGLDWLDKNTNLNDLDKDNDFYYFAWTLQNVAQSTGARQFNKVDLFRQVTTRLLNEQDPKTGMWKGPKGPHVSTSFALMYLARAKGPLAVCKVRFGDSASKGWNNRPNDLYNFATEITRRFEVPTSWQIADLTQPVYELIESPVLYLATDKAFTLPPEQVTRLKEYIDAGGLLVCVPEGSNTKAASTSMAALAQQLCPDREAVKLGADNNHPFFNLAAKIAKPIPMLTWSSATRIRVVVIDKDIGRDLQANDPKERTAYDLLGNIYLYAAGRKPDRPRIVNNYRVQPSAKLPATIAAARIKVEGEFDPEPQALSQLKAMLALERKLDLQLSTLKPEELTAATKVAFLTTTQSLKLSDADGEAIKKWVDAGGTLLVDAAGGSQPSTDAFDLATRKLGVVVPSLPTLTDQPLITGAGLKDGYAVAFDYRIADTVPDRPKPSAYLVNGRPAMIFFRGDLTAGLVGANTWAIKGLVPGSARKLAANVVLSALNPIAAPATNPATAPATP